MNIDTGTIERTEVDATWPVVLGLVWLSILGAFVANVQPIFIGALSDSFSFNAQQLGFLAGIELGGAALASICAVYWFSHVNLRKLAFCSMLVLIFGNLLTTWASNYPLLLVLRFLCGFLGGGVLYAMSVGLMGQLPNAERNMAIMVIGQVLSLAVGMVVLPMLIVNWQLAGMTFTMTLLYSTGLLLFAFIPSHSANQENCVDKENDKKGIRWLPSGLIFSVLLFNIALGCLWVFLERIGNNNGFSLSNIGNALAIGGFIGGAGAILPALFGKKFGRLLPLITGLIGQIFVCFLLVSRDDWASYLLAVSLFNLFWNLVTPYLFGAIAKVDSSGRYMVLIPAAQAGGMAIGPVLAGMFIIGDSYSTAAWVSMATFALCLLLTVPLFRRIS
jgi:predicted MFS family arabinose efflux permease